MKIKLFVLSFLMASLSILSCDFSKSINKDLTTGLLTKGDGLACGSVYLAMGEETIKRNNFLYAEKFLVVFNDIDGFQRVGDVAFPGMMIRITGPGDEVVLFEEDLYSEAIDGFSYDPLQLHGSVVVASPIHSGNEYHLHIKLWDKKGDGTFTADMDFTVEANEQIKIESQQVSYNEIYLFSNEGDLAVKEYVATRGETVFMLFEGLEGFLVKDQMVFPGLSLLITDGDGATILHEEDLIGDSGMEVEQFQSQVAPNFVISGDEISNPVTCEIVIWDKQSEARISGSTQITIVSE